MHKILSAHKFIFRTLGAFIIRLQLLSPLAAGLVVLSQSFYFYLFFFPSGLSVLYHYYYLLSRTNSCTISCSKEIYFASFWARYCDLKPNETHFQPQFLLLSLSETGQPCAQASTQQGTEVQLVFLVHSFSFILTWTSGEAPSVDYKVQNPPKYLNPPSRTKSVALPQPRVVEMSEGQSTAEVFCRPINAGLSRSQSGRRRATRVDSCQPGLGMLNQGHTTHHTVAATYKNSGTTKNRPFKKTQKVQSEEDFSASAEALLLIPSPPPFSRLSFPLSGIRGSFYSHYNIHRHDNH